MSDNENKLPFDAFHYARIGEVGNMETALQHLFETVSSGEDAGYISSRNICYETVTRTHLGKGKHALEKEDDPKKPKKTMKERFDEMEKHFTIAREYCARLSGVEMMRAMRRETWILIMECYNEVLKMDYKVGKALIESSTLLSDVDKADIKSHYLSSKK